MTTVQNAINQFVAARGGRKAARTRQLYEQRLALLAEMYEMVPVEDITGQHVQEWLAVLERRGYAPATMAGYRQAIKSFFVWCHASNLVATNPAAELRIGSFISRRRKLPNQTDLERVLALARQWVYSAEAAQVRDACIVLLSAACGPRSREIRQLRLSEVRRALQMGPDAIGVFVASSQGKTGETLLRFGPDVAEALRLWLTIRPAAATIDVCFTTVRQVAAPGDKSRRFRPLARRSLDGAYEHLCRAAGVPVIRSHAIRHHVGDATTRQYGARVAAMILNHRDADTGATAIAYYHHPDQLDVSRAVRGLDSAEADPINQLFAPHHR